MQEETYDYDIKSYSFYDTYYDLINNMPTEQEKKDLSLVIHNYMFKGELPNKKNVSGLVYSIFNSLIRPLTTSKNNSRKKPETKNDCTDVSNNDSIDESKDDCIDDKGNTTNVVKVNSLSISKSNILEKEKGVIGEKEKTFTDLCKQIIGHLNLKTKSSYAYNTKSTQEKIRARLNEGYVLDDFIAVIDKKTITWLKDEKMCKYLRPETLFGTKFEGYLNEKMKITAKDIPLDFSKL